MYAGYSAPSALFGDGFAEETYAGYSDPSTLPGGGHADAAETYSGYSVPLEKGGGHGNETYSGYEAPPARVHPDADYSGYEASPDGDGNVCVRCEFRPGLCCANYSVICMFVFGSLASPHPHARMGRGCGEADKRDILHCHSPGNGRLAAGTRCPRTRRGPTSRPSLLGTRVHAA